MRSVLLQLQVNYTYLSRRNQTMPSVIQLDTPRHRMYSSATYSRSRWSAIADLTYEGGRWNANDAGTVLRAPSYATAGLGGSVRLYRQAEVQAGLQNLFDRSYFLVQGYPEAGRTFYVNLRYRF